MSKALDLINLIEKKKKSLLQSDQEPQIDEVTLKQLYSKATDQTYPSVFDKLYDINKLKADKTEQLMLVYKDGNVDKISLPLDIPDVTKKAIGVSDPKQSDQLRSYLPKSQLLIRGAYKNQNKTVLIAEVPKWMLGNIKTKGINV